MLHYHETSTLQLQHPGYTEVKHGEIEHKQYALKIKAAHGPHKTKSIKLSFAYATLGRVDTSKYGEKCAAMSAHSECKQDQKGTTCAPNICRRDETTVKKKNLLSETA